MDASGNVYVADINNYRVQRWAPGATSGVTVAGGNGSGSAANQLCVPDGVAVDASGTSMSPTPATTGCSGGRRAATRG